jgi:hypothetical protein
MEVKNKVYESMKFVLIEDNDKTDQISTFGSNHDIERITKKNEQRFAEIQKEFKVLFPIKTCTEMGSSNFTIIGEQKYNQTLWTSGLNPCIGFIVEGTLFLKEKENRFTVLYHHKAQGKTQAVRKLLNISFGPMAEELNLTKVIVDRTTMIRMLSKTDLKEDAEAIKSFFENNQDKTIKVGSCDVVISKDHSFVPIFAGTEKKETKESFHVYIDCNKGCVYVQKGEDCLVLEKKEELSIEEQCKQWKETENSYKKQTELQLTQIKNVSLIFEQQQQKIDDLQLQLAKQKETLKASIYREKELQQQLETLRQESQRIEQSLSEQIQKKEAIICDLQQQLERYKKQSVEQPSLEMQPESGFVSRQQFHMPKEMSASQQQIHYDSTPTPMIFSGHTNSSISSNTNTVIQTTSQQKRENNSSKKEIGDDKEKTHSPPEKKKKPN